MLEDTEHVSLQAAPRWEHPLRQMSLTFDILCAVMPWIRDRKDLLSFISTCSDLYNTGVQILLGFHYAIEPKHLPRFYQFLTSKSPSSFLGLRSLYFHYVTTEDLNVISSLADILSRANNLQHIEMYGDELHPTLYQALASSPSLCSLKLRTNGVDPELRAMFTQLRSPLSNLEFEGTGAQLDVIATLANFHRTLKKLTISELNICHTPTRINYANLTHLSLQFVGCPQLSILVPAFPNLQTLTVKFCPEFGEEREEWRERNIRFQIENPSQKWHLSSLTGDTGGLYMLGLQTAVPDVTVVNFQPNWDLADIEDCLAPLRLVKLSISNEIEPFPDMDWVSGVLEASCNELVRLDLSFMLLSDETYLQQESRLDDLFHEMSLIAISNTHIRFISIDILAQDHFCRASAQERNFAYEFLDTFEADSFAARAIQAIPTLKIAELMTMATCTLEFYWIFKEGGGFMRVPSAIGTELSPIFDSLITPVL